VDGYMRTGEPGVFVIGDIVSILSSEVGYTIAEYAATLGVDRLILGATQRSLVEQALRGDVIRTVSELLPEEIQLIIYRA